MTTQNTTIAVLVGSLRKASINRQLAEVARDNAPDGVTLTIVEGLGDLPFYNEDADPATPDGQGAALPESVVAARAAVAAADAVLIVTPEYNGTIPAVLKNAIDWLSRPYGAGALKDKPVGVIGAALGRFGGKWSREDTRKSVGIAGSRVVEEVEIGITTADLTDEGVGHADVVAQVLVAVASLADAAKVNA
ncbi:NAD(P)H-dependent oxidoreductase [Gordonia sp. TBRC 11910]|uniref:NAD(P)H-dependent oxidoreductase n=1 Tax=Gordonia asplenii TaxID=2725283 RepID=A0A848KUV9_9ACTN|nr:NAD(P)H-dependent oxidoreductase [Gordonia asplenii]NMO02029.1 NAD(P)H-dependent oxidoreductase [Gordonia asplenii]